MRYYPQCNTLTTDSSQQYNNIWLTRWIAPLSPAVAPESGWYRPLGCPPTYSFKGRFSSSSSPDERPFAGVASFNESIPKRFILDTITLFQVLRRTLLPLLETHSQLPTHHHCCLLLTYITSFIHVTLAADLLATWVNSRHAQQSWFSVCRSIVPNFEKLLRKIHEMITFRLLVYSANQ